MSIIKDVKGSYLWNGGEGDNQHTIHAGELIAALSKIPPDTKVWIDIGSESLSTIDAVVKNDDGKCCVVST